MKRDTVSGLLLIGGTLVSLLVLMRHPTGLPSAGDQFASVARLAVWVHAIVIAMSVLVFLGFFGLNRRLAATPDLATAALVSYGFATVTVTIAAAISGLVGTELAARYLSAEEPMRQMAHEIYHYNATINQVFAKISFVATAAAILLWSVAMLRSGALGRALGFAGVALGVGTLGVVLFGPGHVGLHTVLLTYLAQGAWTVWIGIALMRGDGSQAT